MISLQDIPDMVKDYNAGDLDFRVVYSLCLDLFEHNEVAEVFDLLPQSLRDDLASRLHDVYNNDTPPEKFLILSSARGDHPAKHIIIDRIRRWLARHPLESR